MTLHPHLAPVIIDRSRDGLKVTTGYNPYFAPEARKLGGDFIGKDAAGLGVWRFDAREEERVVELCCKIWGHFGAPIELVDVRFDPKNWGNGRELWFAGRLVASRRERDKPVRLGDGVVIIQGGFDSRGGSAANPRLDAKPGTIIEVRDIPATHPEVVEDEDVTVIATYPIGDAPAVEDKKASTDDVPQRALAAALDNDRAGIADALASLNLQELDVLAGCVSLLTDVVLAERRNALLRQSHRPTDPQ